MMGGHDRRGPSVTLPSSGGRLIDWCRVHILPEVRYIMLQRFKYHYKTHPRVPQFRKGPEHQWSFRKISSCAVQAKMEESFLSDNSPPTVTHQVQT